MSLQGAIDTPQLETLLRQGLDRLRQIPGVTAASVSNAVPVERGLNLPIAPPSGARITQTRSVDWRYVTPEYFNVFDIPLLAGRVFDESDRAGGNPVVIVNEVVCARLLRTHSTSSAKRSASFKDFRISRGRLLASWRMSKRGRVRDGRAG